MWERDPEDIREELRDYYGTAAVSGFPMAAAQLFDVDGVDNEELREKAEELGLDTD